MNANINLNRPALVRLSCGHKGPVVINVAHIGSIVPNGPNTCIHMAMGHPSLYIVEGTLDEILVKIEGAWGLH